VTQQITDADIQYYVSTLSADAKLYFTTVLHYRADYDATYRCCQWAQLRCHGDGWQCTGA